MSIVFVANDFWPPDFANTSFDESEFLPLDEGHFLIAFLVNLDPGDAPNAPSGWTEISSSPVVLPDPPNQFFATMWAFWKVLGAAETGVYDFSNGDPESSGWYGNFEEYSGTDPANPVAVNSKDGTYDNNAATVQNLPSVTVPHTGGILLAATTNQGPDNTFNQPVIATMTLRSEGPVYVFDRSVAAGPTGDVEVVYPGPTGFILGFLLALNPPIEPGARFDCATVDSQIN